MRSEEFPAGCSGGVVAGAGRVRRMFVMWSGGVVMKRWVLAAGVIAVLYGLGAATASGQTLLEIRSWKPSFDATGLATAGGVGTEVDFVGDLGLSDERFTGFRLSWDSGPRSFITVGYEVASYSGEQGIVRAIDFDGRRFDAGKQVRTDLDMRTVLLRWGWQFIATPDRRVALGPMMELAGISVEGMLDTPDHDPRVLASRRFETVVPALGVALNLSPSPQVHIFAHAATLPATSQGRYDSGEVGLLVRSYGGIFLSLGYRITRLKVEKEPDFVTLDQTGTYFGLAYRF